MDKINILMSVNKKFLEHAEEMIFSLLYYSSLPIDLFIMYQEKELSKNDIDKLTEFVAKTSKGKLLPIKFDATMLEGVKVTGEDGYFFSVEAYSRLFCPFYLPQEIEKVLYLDVDMICTGDIKELFNIPLDGKLWGGAQDKDIKGTYLKRLGLPTNYIYINSGMSLINLKKFRENYTENDIISLIRENHENWIYVDQDFINKIFVGDIKIIDIKYNLLAKSVRYKDLETKPLIIHYAGSVKPWDDNVSRFDREFIEPYYEILRLQKDTKKLKLEQLIENHKKYGYNN